MNTKTLKEPLVRLKQKGQLTIPAKIREAVGLDEGDYVSISQQGHRIVLTPFETAERHPAIDAALAEGLADMRAGRMTPAFDTFRELEKWLKTEEGKRFSKQRKK